MKHAYLIPIMLMSTSSLVFGQLTKNQSVLQTLNQIAAALRSNNTAALDTLYANDYTSVNTRGFLVNKASRLESIKSGRLKYESYNYKNVKIRLYGNTAVVNATIQVKIKGVDDNSFLSTLILIKNGEQWQVVNAQTNIVQ
jgi:hypothetical protein